ncbi:MAG: glutamine synthetase family protein [Clostridiales bacterium]|nr:glutamine synthetase family protein [Clostridiales bacterium]
MGYTDREILSFIRDNDVKFVRLAFRDLFGRQKNIAIISSELERAVTSGFAFDASSVRGFAGVERSDMFLAPDTGTLAVLPWRPGHGRVARLYCDVVLPDGSPHPSDFRAALRRAGERANKLGYTAEIGVECEFYLFKTDEAGKPTDVPLDEGGYLDVSPLDMGENVRREICLALEGMGITPESSHHERGAGQNEVDFRHSGALAAADNLMTLKSVVRAVAQSSGLSASFLPKPLADQASSCLHINISLKKNGENVIKLPDGEHSPEAGAFMAGILARAAELGAFTNPIPNSYDRLRSPGAPKYVSWSHQNRSALIRIPAGERDRARIELRSPDPSLNPYLAFYLLLMAGLDGIEEGLAPPPPSDGNLFEGSPGLPRLPETLPEALSLAAGSAFVAKYVNEYALSRYFAGKEAEKAEEIRKAVLSCEAY